MRILLLADLHIGAIPDRSYVYQVLSDIMEKELVLQKTDAVILLGDYFHRLCKANEENISLAINVMSLLIRSCVRSRTKIRIVYGTESHEMTQYRLFNHHMTSKKVDLKLFTTVAEEELFPGYHVLYIPEEYIQDPEKHYHDTLYSEKHYNAIFGHGFVSEGMPAGIPLVASHGKERQVPHFHLSDLSPKADQVCFGHYHLHTEMDDHSRYIGSLFRWKFEENPPKGYGILDDEGFHFVENPDAYCFETYEYGPTDPIYHDEAILHQEIERIYKEHPDMFGETFHGKIRMKFTVPKDYDPTFRDRLGAILSGEKRISILFTNLNDVLMEEVKETLPEEYDYVIDRDLPIPDKIHHYIISDLNEAMELATVSHYLDKILKK